MSEESQAQNQTDRLGTSPIRGLLLSMAIPAVTAQLITLLYNIVDRMYVGHIAGEGTLALAGLGITFPITMLVAGFGNLVGSGGAARASITLGQKDNAGAEHILGNCITLMLVLSAALMVLFRIFMRPILVLFGASEGILPYAESYLSIYLLGTVFVMATLSLNPFITNQGYAKISMATTCIGAVLNIILDPIFIFGLGLGVRGAAAATVLSQAVSAIWVVRFLMGPRSTLHVTLPNLQPNPAILGAVLSLGVSSFIMHVTECLVQLVYNNGMRTYGSDEYIALMSILFSALQMVYAANNGFAQGSQPIIGYNYGAARYDRVRETIALTAKINLTITLTVVALVELFPGAVIGAFSSDAAIVAMGIAPLRVFLAGMCLMGFQGAAQQAFISMGQAGTSMFVACLRKLIIILPLAILLPRLGLGVWGLFIAEPIGDVLSVSTCAVLLYRTVRRLPKTAAEQE